MSKRTFFLAFVLAGVITATALPTANDNWVVRQQSIGPVKIGMTISHLNAALREKFSKS